MQIVHTLQLLCGNKTDYRNTKGQYLPYFSCYIILKYFYIIHTSFTDSNSPLWFCDEFMRDIPAQYFLEVLTFPYFI